MSSNNEGLTSQMKFNMKRMWPYAKPIWPAVLLSVLVSIPVGALDAVVALFLKPYTDMIMVGKDMSATWLIPILIVCFSAVQGILNFVATYLSTWVGGKMSMSMRAQLYEKLVTMDSAYFDKSSSGEIQTRYNSDASTACSGLVANVKNFIVRVFSSFALIGVLFYNSWQLSIVAIIALGVAIIPLVRVRKMIKDIVAKSIVNSSEINTIYVETFSGNRIIAAYNLQKRQEKYFAKITEEAFELSLKMVRRTGWLSPVMHIVTSIGLALAVGFGSWLIVNGTISAGNFVSFLAALLLLYTPIKLMSGTILGIQQSFLALDRVFELLETETGIKEAENAIVLDGLKEDVVFENVSFAYEQDRPVLNKMSFSAKRGESIALVGNSGGGKSTTVSLLTRFYEVTEGAIKIDGVNIKDYSLFSLRENIAMVFQDNFLFNTTIRENLVLSREDVSDEQLWQVLENAYLADFIRQQPKGLETEIGERGVLLSGGQKQRLAIARAFLKDAPIIVLDEATSALDNKSERVVQKAIDKLMRNKTVFVIAHRLSTVRNATKIVVINEGEMMEVGSHDELLLIENGHYRSLYEMQFAPKEELIVETSSQNLNSEM